MNHTPSLPHQLALAGLALGAAGAFAACTTPRATTALSPDGGSPRLVVMIIVDQLREPLLERYDDLYAGGFRRLMDEGHFYVQATHDHANTETAVGHATLATGTYPMHHGIIANEWWVKTPAGWVEVSNVGDSTLAIIGSARRPGVSPHYLVRSGLADWLTAADPRSQVASVSAKDRGAVLPAAHARGQVYWFDDATGRFVTSTYYREAYPSWARRFNERAMRRYAGDTIWASRVPAAARSRSTGDTAAWEGDGIHTSFPHHFADEGMPGAFWSWFATTPMLDAATLDFARTMVSSLGLGRDDDVDFLSISLSQTDRIGHAYGPESREQLDNLLRLDGELADFFRFLDSTVGKNRWITALSADHGSLIAPETRPQPGEPSVGRRATPEEKASLAAVVKEAEQWDGDSATPERMKAALEQLPFVAEAWTHEDLLYGTPDDSFAVLERRSLYPGRYGGEFSRWDVEVRFEEGLLARVRGTTHGTPYWYDRHVPMIFMGPGIPAGRDSTRVSTTDFAPTLARLVGVPFPTDVDGKPLPGVVGR